MTARADLPAIRANAIEPTPSWAVMQRQLFATVEEAALYAADRYDRPDGTPYNAQDADDAYEAHSYRGHLYALGGSDAMLDLAFRQWNAITRLYDDGTPVRKGDPVHPKHECQLHNEYYDAHTDTPADWFHMGEGNQSFYDFGLADPTNPLHVRRARRFADMYTGDDDAAPNYDAEHRIIRSPFHGSRGPNFHGDLEFVKRALDPVYYPGGVAHGHAQRSNLYPIVENLEEDWFENESRREEIMALFDRMVLDGDIPDNLGATALITNAFLYTGDDRYRTWVLDYTQAWLERTRANDGLIPDNIGPTGIIGEHRNGQWWGGWYGWNSRNSSRNALQAALIAAECALLLTGDSGYLELIRSPVEYLLDMASTRDDGQLVVPTRITESGWENPQPMRLNWLGRLYHASMDRRDGDLIERLRDGERELDWNEIDVAGDRSSGNLEARYNYYDGRFDDWPTQRLRAELFYVDAMYESMRLDPRDVATIIEDSRWPPNPVVTKGLAQVTTGAPQPIYNGGLSRATVRYFDADRRRPGLPADVAALVDGVQADGASLQLVNLSSSQPRRLIVQAGAFGEHRFTEARWQEQIQEDLDRHAGIWLRGGLRYEERRTAVDGRHVMVTLPPSASLQLDLGMQRFAHPPSYAQPWHAEGLPVV
jgi:hypothetical protein